MAPHLGCIADDFTGATDLANNLVRAGMRVVLYLGVPTDISDLDADAIVLALKSRTIPPSEAVAQSLAACRWLRSQQVRQIYFKVCSTFDSTPRGNIGPVLEALMRELDCKFSVATPAFPENARTVFLGHLFVGATLLSESGMRHHPLTPMSDANLVRVLEAQLRDRRVGLIDFRTIATSAEAISDRMAALEADGVTIAIADAVSDADLVRLGAALIDASLVTASSGLATSLPRHWGFVPSSAASLLPSPRGRSAIVSGSCSDATNAQVQYFRRQGGHSYWLDPLRLAADVDAEVTRALDWVEALWRSRPDATPLVASTANSTDVAAIHAELGVFKAGALVEEALGSIALGLVARGVGRLIVAGGETSGICVQQLGIRQILVGPQIAPGVPWCYATQAVGRSEGLHIALKSGNFGSVDFFHHAFSLLLGDAL
jgi:uncharacterized protein YgbK (DUF1537 family)